MSFFFEFMRAFQLTYSAGNTCDIRYGTGECSPGEGSGVAKSAYVHWLGSESFLIISEP
jgi:hypothetical protein